MPHKILFAEDNSLNQKMTIRILEKLGYEVEAVSNGKEALDKFIQKKYNAILMDVQKPVMNGIEASILIREK